MSVTISGNSSHASDEGASDEGATRATRERDEVQGQFHAQKRPKTRGNSI